MAQSDGQRLDLAVSGVFEPDLVAGGNIAQCLAEVEGRRNGFSIDLKDDISFFQTRFLGCCVGDDLSNDEAFFGFSYHGGAHSEEAGTDQFVVFQFLDQVLEVVRGNDKADSTVDTESLAQDDGDSDDFSIEIHQGSSRIGGTDRGIGLDGPAADSVESTDDAKADRRLFGIVGLAHRHDELADDEFV